MSAATFRPKNRWRSVRRLSRTLQQTSSWHELVIPSFGGCRRDAVIYALSQHENDPYKKVHHRQSGKKSTRNEDYGPDVKLSPDGLLLDSDGQVSCMLHALLLCRALTMPWPPAADHAEMLMSVMPPPDGKMIDDNLPHRADQWVAACTELAGCLRCEGNGAERSPRREAVRQNAVHGAAPDHWVSYALLEQPSNAWVAMRNRLRHGKDYKSTPMRNMDPH